MLPRDNRLRRSWEFRRARRRGRSYAHPLVALNVYRPPADSGAGTPCPPSLRAGFSVSKRVGKATVRNRVKRRMREALRANLMQVKPGYDLILSARPPAANATYGEIRHAIEDLLTRSSLLQDPHRHA